tara:strand:+ start:2634 stop:3221 length:588 start_codon:yes stop_codon:yes gene_type:complete
VIARVATAKNGSTKQLNTEIYMKKLMTILMTLTLFISANSAMAKDLANVINLDSKEAFFQDYSEKMEASKKQLKKLLKKDDKFLDKHFGEHVVTLKEKQEELLFDLGLDHVSTTREVIEVMMSDEGQNIIVDHMEAKMMEAGGFEAFKSNMEAVSNNKGVISSFFRAIINAVATVVFWIFVYPFMFLLVITGNWY